MMICYRDMTFCSAECATMNCPRQFTDEHRVKAKAWWGNENPPVAFCDFSGGCPSFKRASPSTDEEPQRGDTNPSAPTE